MALKEEKIRVRYTNLLLCGPPCSGRSSFLRLLLEQDVKDDNLIARMIMRTPKLKFDDLAKYRWEWEKLDYKTLRTIVTSHVKVCGAAAVRPSDVSEQSISATSGTKKQKHYHSTDEHVSPLISRDEYSFERFLIESLSLHIEQQSKFFLDEKNVIENVINGYKLLKPEEKFYKLLFSFRTKDEVDEYISLLGETLSQFKKCDLEQLLQKKEIVDLFIDKLLKLNNSKLKGVLSKFLAKHPQHFQSSMFSSTHPIPFSFSASSSSPPSLNTCKPQVIASHPSSVCKEILCELPMAEHPDGKALHFINIVATSGPLSFLNTIPSILNYTTVNLITHRLDIPLEERYSESAIHFKDSTTHIDMLDNLIRSLSFSQKPHTESITARTEPRRKNKMFLVVGTCLDRIDKVELRSKNELLEKRFDKIFDTLLLDAGSILFAVNNLKPSENETEKLMLIRRKVCKHYIEVDIPIKWYLLQLELMSLQESCDLLPFDEVLHIGERFQMSGDDVKNALSFFHNMTIIFYFPAALPSKVFVNPSIFLAKLANATRKHQLYANVFCASDKQLPDSQLLESHLLESHLEIQPQEIQLLEIQPLESQLLESRRLTIKSLTSQLLQSKLPESQSQKSQRLESQHLASQLLGRWLLERRLLGRLLLVLQLRYSRSCSFIYRSELFPSSLGSYVIDPLVISWDHKIPCGLFHALCVKLGQSDWGLPSQCLQNIVHFRDKQVTFIDHHCHWIEIHYEGQNFDACFKIKCEIHKAIQHILALFNIDVAVLPQKIEYFLCFAKHHQPDHICIINENESAICVHDGSRIGITERQRPWLTPHIEHQ